MSMSLIVVAVGSRRSRFLRTSGLSLLLRLLLRLILESEEKLERLGRPLSSILLRDGKGDEEPAERPRFR